MMRPLPHAKGVRVLVVDDSHIHRKILVRYLSKRGFVYAQAENGQIALDLHNHTPFDMILTDIDMPVLNGLEMVKILREQERQETDRVRGPVPVIGISGYVFPEDMEAAEWTGINEYIGKPFKFPELDAKMGRYLCSFRSLLLLCFAIHLRSGFWVLKLPVTCWETHERCWTIHLHPPVLHMGWLNS